MSVADSPPLLPASPGPGAVPSVPENEMWAAELAYLPDNDGPSRQAQFAIRTAVRAQQLANLAGSNPIDELLDARACATNHASQRIYETAINYLNREMELQRACWWPVSR